jgi:hypothetical protein
MGLERWEHIKRVIFELGRARVRAGIVGPQALEPHGDSGLTNAEMGLVHELGTPIIPARSFVGATLRDPSFLEEFENLTGRLTEAVLDGKMDRDRALGLLGAWVANEIASTITDDLVDGPALAPQTVAAKGTDKLLVDSGQLAGAISWEIER